MTTASHFDLLGLAPAFAIDADQLDRAYRDLQSRVHPDRFANASDADRRASMQWSVRANEAYATLKDPLRRATHLLELRGTDLGIETNTAMEPAFLVEQIEWREAIEDARMAANVDQLERLLARLREDKRLRYERLGGLLGSGADAPATEVVRQLMFLEKLQAEIGDAIAMLEES
jgi:molecular chaperone HscB